ncbi:elongation factor P [Patescibacteria group bacterium]|nr:elongation factor P [Patescibacteria group bacterium]
MLTHTDLRRGVRFILNNEPCEVLEAASLKMAQRRPVVQTRIKNLINGNVQEKNFQQGDVFEEADLEKIKVKFLYANRGSFFFCEEKDPSKRFSLSPNQIGPGARFLKPNEIMEGITFNNKIINVSPPIKVQIKVRQAPPGIKGDRAQGGTKSVVLESGAEINVPLFIKEGDIIEINTESGQYTKRVDKK